MKVAVSSVFFDGCDGFISDFINSLNNQVYLDFDFIALFDNINQKDMITKTNLNEITLKVSKPVTPSINRKKIIEYTLEQNYDCLIFCDPDDIVHPHKVKRIIENIGNYDFVFHDMMIINDNNMIISESIFDVNNINPDEEIKNYLSHNIVGLGCSGINLNKLKKIPYPSDIYAFDWWLFTNILMYGGSFKYISEPLTNYRQHIENFVGIRNEISYDRLIKGIKVKKNHYLRLAEVHIDKRDSFKKLYNEICELEDEVLLNENFKNTYISIINKNFKSIYKGWWSEILPVKEWEKYV
jgi:hypothetical protein